MPAVLERAPEKARERVLAEALSTIRERGVLPEPVVEAEVDPETGREEWHLIFPLAHAAEVHREAASWLSSRPLADRLGLVFTVGDA